MKSKKGMKHVFKGQIYLLWWLSWFLRVCSCQVLGTLISILWRIHIKKFLSCGIQTEVRPEKDCTRVSNRDGCVGSPLRAALKKTPLCKLVSYLVIFKHVSSHRTSQLSRMHRSCAYKGSCLFSPSCLFVLVLHLSITLNRNHSCSLRF